ncbi:alpha/beta fold hydrolase [Streptacidiphilus griseoplanus]|uniref:alpha/beta fold hydrolase n=1 Tax=Peterkaempfera griseoplana TaxID=66896 RepID=UPI0006E244A8|nr:alpha/beta fold hydrolase [Peterkaempfera griseoplana]
MEPVGRRVRQWWRGWPRRARRLTAAVLALAAVAGGAGVWRQTASGGPVVHVEQRFLQLPESPGSSRRVAVDTSFLTAGGPGRRPAVLLAHGFGGSKNDVRAQAEQLARSGYAVLTWSARGFGRSGGRIALDSPDAEVQDVRALVDWLARRPEVQLDGAGDPRVGVAGASYGGAISLLAAAYDRRIDAIAPQITWWNLADALFPQNAVGGSAADGVFKRLWAGIFFTSGSASLGASGSAAASAAAPAAAGASGCGRFTDQLCEMYNRVAVAGHADPAAVKLLDRSSPSSVADRIRVPTLVVQGLHDSLFPLDQGDAIARAVAANGAPVAVDWFDGGHDGGNQESGRVQQRITAWFDHYLKGSGAATGPAFRVTRTGGLDSTGVEPVLRGATAERYPGLDGTTRRTVALTGPEQTAANPAGGSPPALSTVPGVSALTQLSAAGAGLTLDLPGQSAVFTSAPLPAAVRVTGTPRITVRVHSDRPDAVLFGKVYDVAQDGTRTLPQQLAAPLRVTGADSAAGRTLEVRLPAVDHEFAAGHRMAVVLATTDLAYASPVQPAHYRIAAVGPGLVVPADQGLRTAAPPLPGWVWGLPAAAVAFAALLLLTGRGRLRRTPPPDPLLAAVPLQITGLSKRYAGAADRYAVRDLGFRVEQGQVVGLLGPNGAGKTTTLRMLMGLIRPDGGDIRIFGHAVRGGSPVLSRVGAFVEGAGFLPHLTGRDNLRLYWQATGRPAGDAHLDEALEIAALGEALDRAVRTYSQGMRQRLAIAQAMLGLPELLILDEPTNGLDPPQIREMREVLIRYAATGRTVIVSSHLLSEVEQSCSHLVVMDQGRLVAAGAVADIVGAGGLLMVSVVTSGPEALDEGGVTAAAEKIAALEGVASAEAADGGVLVALDGLAPHRLLAELVRLGIPVERLAPHRRLEDAFLSLIGGPA